MNQVQLDARKQEEMDYHNKREEFAKSVSRDEYEAVWTNAQFYSVAHSSLTYAYSLLKESKGIKVLVYCCGTGRDGGKIAKMFQADVTGIDISDTCIESANKMAQDENITDRCRFFVMDAEHTTFEDNTFDIIYCCGCLHHLDLDAAYKELYRILKPGGKIIAYEALCHNPIIHLYRKLTPKLRTSWEVDHILSRGRIYLSQKYFDGLHIKCFHLFSILAVPFRKSKWFFKPVLKLMELIDAVVLRIPGVRWWAWICVFVLTKKKK